MTQLGLLNADATAPAERGRIHVHFGDWREQEPSWPVIRGRLAAVGVNLP